MSLSWVLCVVPGRGLCDGPITRPGESYRSCLTDVIKCSNSSLHLQWLRRKRLDWERKVCRVGLWTQNTKWCRKKLLSLSSTAKNPTLKMEALGSSKTRLTNSETLWRTAVHRIGCRSVWHRWLLKYGGQAHFFPTYQSELCIFPVGTSGCVCCRVDRWMCNYFGRKMKQCLVYRTVQVPCRLNPPPPTTPRPGNVH